MSSVSAQRAWIETLAWLLLAWLGLIALQPASLATMVAVWDSSETYAHGYAILPISLYLVWRRWRHLAALPAAPDWHALGAAAGLAALGLAARIGGAQVVEHYALTGLLITAVWGVLGRRVAVALTFPLAYLLFMVPSGDSLIDPLIDITADFTVAVVRLIGIPVYREGVFFSLPSGDWSVVEACSGMRYLLASLALGWLYAYLTYRTWQKRLLFGLASLIVPIFANGVRAALIVLLGHYSGMTLAVGVDHLIYGWVWFGVVMMAMFWVGNRWREDDQVEAPPGPIRAPASPAALVTVLLVLVALIPLYEGHLRARPPQPSPLAALAPPAGWTPLEQPFTHWTPHWTGTDDERLLFLGQGEDQVLLYVAWYGAQRQGRELINAGHRVTPERHPIWRRLQETARITPQGEVREALLSAGPAGQRLVARYWNRIAGQDQVSPLQAKAALALRKLLDQGDAGAVVIVAAPYFDKPDHATALLDRFTAEAKPALDAVLDRQETPAP